MALKCDLREEQEDEDEQEQQQEKEGRATEHNPQNNNATAEKPRQIVGYQEGLAMAKRIGALRYLGMSKRRFFSLRFVFHLVSYFSSPDIQ